MGGEKYYRYSYSISFSAAKFGRDIYTHIYIYTYISLVFLTAALASLRSTADACGVNIFASGVIRAEFSRGLEGN